MWSVICVECVCVVGGYGRYVCVFFSAVALPHLHVHIDSSIAILHLHFILSK